MKTTTALKRNLKVKDNELNKHFGVAVAIYSVNTVYSLSVISINFNKSNMRMSAAVYSAYSFSVSFLYECVFDMSYDPLHAVYGPCCLI